MIIDCHTHVPWRAHKAPDLISHLDAIGVDKAWVLTWEAIDGGLDHMYCHIPSKDIMAAAKQYPKRLIPFCAVDPRREFAEKILRDLVKKGCRGYGELKVRLMYDNPDCIRMFHLCAELNLPVLLHIDVPLPGNSFWYGGSVDALERAIKQCPKTRFIGHGPGFWREISGSAARSKKTYPWGKVVPGGKLQKLLTRYPNLYADLSAGSGLSALKRDVAHGRRFLKKFHNRLLYGTDIFTRDLLDFLEGLKLPKKVFENIAWRNAERLVPIAR